MSAMTFTQGFYALITIISIVALIMTIRIGQKQRTQGNDEGNPTIMKHPYRKNPVFWSYILFPILIAIFGALWIATFE